jgi:hypothetical protein
MSIFELLKTSINNLFNSLEMNLLIQKYFNFFLRSLVQTNDHLLKEMDDSKRRHQHEVEQLNWSYNQLKKSMMGTSSHTLGTSSHTYKGDNNASAILYESN